MKSDITRLFSSRRPPGGSRRSIVIGASIGAGSSAAAAVQGGADFLLAGNVGRFRMMGAPSCACHLPLRDSNRLVTEFARTELSVILGRVPVFLGIAACDWRLDIKYFVQKVRDWGFDGICNFPTSCEFSGAFRQTLELAGLGFGREIELLAHGKDAGLLVLGYAHTAEEVSRLLAIDADIVSLALAPQLGLTATSTIEELEVAAGLAQSIVRMVHGRSPRTLCLCGGAAISSPELMLRLCDLMKADGYIGGSTIDLVPVQTSIENRVSEFKAVSTLQRRLEAENSERERLSRRFGFSGESERMRNLYARIAQAARSDEHIVITGEAGVGKTFASRVVHQLSARRGGNLSTLMCESGRALTPDMELFGVAGGVEGVSRTRIGLLSALTGGTLIMEPLDRIPFGLQKELLWVMEQGLFRPVGSSNELPANSRLIFNAGRSLDELFDRGLIIHELYLRLKPFAFQLPPLRDRQEDIPAIAEQMLATVHHSADRRVKSIEREAMRFLQQQSWPGNLRDLLSTIRRAAISATGVRIELADLKAISITQVERVTEHERIIDALHRHKFRKGEAASFLGISRKTLYNKMKRYRLLSAVRPRVGGR